VRERHNGKAPVHLVKYRVAHHLERPCASRAPCYIGANAISQPCWAFIGEAPAALLLGLFRLPSNGLNLGFLVDTLAEDYQHRIFTGLNNEAIRINASVCCFVGGALSVTGALSQRNRVYDCVSDAYLGGLVVATGAIGNQVSDEALTGFVQGFTPLPNCSVGVALPDCPSVTVDNQAGMREALTHLITEVGRRRIAFIRGPETNREAEERFRVYLDVLSEHRLSLDPELVAMGDFEAASGAQAVRTLIDERHMGFDAIVAASDLMALGALNALLERGVAVPERVSVVGFDDIEAARYATSPLTTVAQPLHEIGKRALETVVNQIYTNDEPRSTVLPARLVRRQSTLSPLDSAPPTDPKLGTFGAEESIEQSYRNVRIELFAELRREVSLPGLDQDWPEQLCNGFVSEAGGRRAGLLKRSTLDFLEQLLLRVVELDGDSNAFQRVISRMRSRLRPLFAHNTETIERAEDLWHRARVLIGGIAERHQVQHRLQLRHWRRCIGEVGAELVRAANIEQVQRCMDTRLATLGIPACAVCTFEPGRMSRVQAAFDVTAPITWEGGLFPERNLLPPGVLDGPRRRTMIVEALYLSERATGYVVFEMGPTEAEVYAVLTDALTGALRGISAERAAR
jgi:phosphoserine phosphatase RsbU/P